MADTENVDLDLYLRAHDDMIQRLSKVEARLNEFQRYAHDFDVKSEAIIDKLETQIAQIREERSHDKGFINGAKWAIRVGVVMGGTAIVGATYKVVSWLLARAA